MVLVPLRSRLGAAERHARQLRTLADKHEREMAALMACLATCSVPSSMENTMMLEDRLSWVTEEASELGQQVSSSPPPEQQELARAGALLDCLAAEQVSRFAHLDQLRPPVQPESREPCVGLIGAGSDELPRYEKKAADGYCARKGRRRSTKGVVHMQRSGTGLSQRSGRSSGHLNSPRAGLQETPMFYAETVIESILPEGSTAFDLGSQLVDMDFEITSHDGSEALSEKPFVPIVLPFWQFSPEDQLSLGKYRRSNTKIASQTTGIEERSGDRLEHESVLRRFVLDPSDIRRLTWDMLSVLVIMWDILTLPLGVFNIEEWEVAIFMRQITTVFWIIDLICNFFVGYQLPDGRTEMRVHKIASRYLKSWFAPDLMIVCSDLFLEFFDQAGTADVARIGKMARMMRVMRCLRMLRVLRVVKLLHSFERICDFVISGPLLTFVNICKLLVGLAIMVHFMACAWYAIGRLKLENNEQSWLSELAGDPDTTKSYLYITSYHWTMAQFTPAPNNFHPTNLLERVYAVGVLFVGLVLFSSLLGNTTALLNVSRREALERMKEWDDMRLFLSQNQVSLRLSNQIVQFVRATRFSCQAHLSQSDIPVLKTLPMSMQSELRYEVFAPRLDLAVIQWLRILRESVVAELCSSGISEVVYNKGEEPFVYRKRGTHVFFITGGSLVYSPGMQRFLAGNSTTRFGQVTVAPKPITEGDVLSEAALWLEWEHRGILSAENLCPVLKLCSEAFKHAMERHTSTVRSMKAYVVRFMKRVQNKLDEEDEIDDTFVPFHTIDEASGTNTELMLPCYHESGVQGHVGLGQVQGKPRCATMLLNYGIRAVSGGLSNSNNSGNDLG